MSTALQWTTTAFMAGVVLCGCSTPSAPRIGALSPQPTFEQRGPRQLLADSRATKVNGNTSRAIPMLAELIVRFPDSKEANEARYLLGMTYYEIDAYRDAIEMLGAYLEVDPEGRHSAEARDLLSVLTREYERRFPSADRLDRSIKDLSGQLASNPGSFTLKRKLADSLWLRGRYEESAERYQELIEMDSVFAEESIFKSRIELQNDGSYVVLSPSEIMRREIDRRPISITSTTLFRTERERVTQIPRFYVVSGQVINRSDSVLYGVEVRSTLYGFGSQVYDTGFFRVGQLSPGEVRAFTIRFRNFRDLNSVGRYETTAVFQR